MIVEYSEHAKVRLRERRASKETIEKALVKFQNIRQVEEGKFLCYYTENNQTLVVVFTKKREYIRVITIFYENNVR